MLDRYIQGAVSRISPEAPVPIVVEQDAFYQPGGASSVAQNLSALGANVLQVGRVGNDFEGSILKRSLKKQGVNISGIFIDKKVPTITKTRVIAQHQQVVRIDREKVNQQGEKAVVQKVLNFIKKHLPAVDAVILSDYGKGMLTPSLIDFVRDLALEHDKILSVDPKVENFSYYRNVTSITPNLKEAENAIRNIKVTAQNGDELGIRTEKITSDKDIDAVGKALCSYLELESLLLTLGEQGMRLFQKGKKPFSIKTKAREVFDVTGAGDSVISVFTLALTAGATMRQAAELSNFAAGVVVGKIGAVAISKEDLVAATNM